MLGELVLAAQNDVLWGLRSSCLETSCSCPCSMSGVGASVGEVLPPGPLGDMAQILSATVRWEESYCFPTTPAFSLRGEWAGMLLRDGGQHPKSVLSSPALSQPVWKSQPWSSQHVASSHNHVVAQTPETSWFSPLLLHLQGHRLSPGTSHWAGVTASLLASPFLLPSNSFSRQRQRGDFKY